VPDRRHHDGRSDIAQPEFEQEPPHALAGTGQGEGTHHQHQKDQAQGRHDHLAGSFDPGAKSPEHHQRRGENHRAGAEELQQE
jgi:hypothetical protein